MPDLNVALLIDLYSLVVLDTVSSSPPLSGNPGAKLGDVGEARAHVCVCVCVSYGAEVKIRSSFLASTRRRRKQKSVSMESLRSTT